MDLFFVLSFVPLTAILNLNDEQLGSSFIFQNIQASLDWKRHALYANFLRYFDIQIKMASCTSRRRSLDLSCAQLPKNRQVLSNGYHKFTIAFVVSFVLAVIIFPRISVSHSPPGSGPC